MSFITIEELSAATGFSRRTIDRKLDAMKATEPEKYSQLVKTIPHTKRLSYSIRLVEMLGISKKVIHALAEEIIPPKPPKPPKQAKQKPQPKPIEQAEVIHVEEMEASIEKDMAILNSILDAYGTGQYSVQECCVNQGISFATFMYWITTRPDFADLFDTCQKRHKKAFDLYVKEIAKESLKKMITGYDKAVESVTYEQKISPAGEPILIPLERKVQNKHVLPNSNLIMFALTNRDPNEWKIRNAMQQATREPDQDPFEKMSDAELDAYLNDAARKGYISTTDRTSENQEII